MPLYLKACPRCGGDLLFQEVELGEFELSCLQCGHVAPASQAAITGRRQPVLVGPQPEPERRKVA